MPAPRESAITHRSCVQMQIPALMMFAQEAFAGFLSKTAMTTIPVRWTLAQVAIAPILQSIAVMEIPAPSMPVPAAFVQTQR